MSYGCGDELVQGFCFSARGCAQPRLHHAQPVSLTDDRLSPLVAHSDLAGCVDENDTNPGPVRWAEQFLCVLDCRMTHLRRAGLCEIGREHWNHVG